MFVVTASILCTNLLPVDAPPLIFHLLQEKDYDQADRYADLAMNADRYNPAALTNKGNTVFSRQDYEKAAEFYKEALRNDSSCTEALYNLGSIHFPFSHVCASRGPHSPVMNNVIAHL